MLCASLPVSQDSLKDQDGFERCKAVISLLPIVFQTSTAGPGVWLEGRGLPERYRGYKTVHLGVGGPQDFPGIHVSGLA